MAVDMFIKIDDIKGESEDARHKDEIDVLAWGWCMAQDAAPQSGSGGTAAGKVSFKDLSFTKYVDAATPLLMLSCSSGRHLKEAVLTMRRAGPTPFEYVMIRMGDVFVTSVSTGGSSGEDRGTENVTLNFARVELDYTKQKVDGSADETIQYKWDIRGITALK
jgi:type VI secretion system secreted protein Hcp